MEGKTEDIKKLVCSLRPIMQRDGGDVWLDSYDEQTNTVSLRFRRANFACVGANGAMMMLYKKKICSAFPSINQVLISEDSES